MAENIGLTIGADNLCHICERANRLLGHIDVTIFANSILIYQKRVIDMHIARITVVAHNLFKVIRSIVGEIVPGHVLCGEVQHHWNGRVGCQVNTLTALLLTETLPIVLVSTAIIIVVVTVWQILRCQIGNGVGDQNIRVAAHVFTTCGRSGTICLAASQVLHHNGIVEHAGMNQQFLLSRA